MDKKIFKKLAIILLLTIIMISSFVLNSNVNATSSESNEERKVTIDMLFDNIETKNLEDEKIMEYDVTTGITKEVDMEAVRESIALKQAKSGKTIDKIESYNPLAKSSSFKYNTITPYAIFNRVSDMSSLPYKATCRIKANTIDGGVAIASGYIAGPKLLVTAAHCVMELKNNDNLYSNWVAYPGYNNGSSYKGLSSGYTKIYYSSNWKSTHSAEYDWCVCILASDMGNTTTWCGSQAYATNAEMNNLAVRLLGYPKDMGGGEYQYYSFGQISNTHDTYFECSARTIGGFSGGPFARTSDDYVVGVCSGQLRTNTNISVGTRLTQNIINIMLENF